MKVRKSTLNRALIALLFLLPFVWLSLSLLGPYKYGDQLYYRGLYQELARASIVSVLSLQSTFTGSSEPLYGLTMWLGSSLGIGKDIYITFFNVVLLLSLTWFLRKNRANWLFVLFSVTNFYVFVLLTGAERLKFSYVLLALALCFDGRRLKLIFFALAPLFHFQTLLLYGVMACGRISLIKIRRRITANVLIIRALMAGTLIVAASFFVYKFSGALLGKFQSYSGGGFDLLEMLNVAALAIVALIVLPRKWEAGFVMVACLIAVAIVGPERVNMIAVSAFFYFVVRDKKTAHPLVLMLMVYFSFKSIAFVSAIYTYGNGFA